MVIFLARTSALLATGTWLGVIAYLSLVPRVKFVEGAPYQALLANLGHYGMYVILTVLLWGSFAVMAWVSARRPGRSALALVFGIASAYGGGMELLQGLVATRGPSWSDAVLNAAGAATGIAVAALLLKAVAGHPALPRPLARLVR